MCHSAEVRGWSAPTALSVVSAVCLRLAWNVSRRAPALTEMTSTSESFDGKRRSSSAMVTDGRSRNDGWASQCPGMWTALTDETDFAIANAKGAFSNRIDSVTTVDDRLISKSCANVRHTRCHLGLGERRERSVESRVDCLPHSL